MLSLRFGLILMRQHWPEHCLTVQPEACNRALECTVQSAPADDALIQGNHTMSIEKTFQGAYKISANINGYLVTRQYMGYTKREAIQAFKEFTKQG